MDAETGRAREIELGGSMRPALAVAAAAYAVLAGTLDSFTLASALAVGFPGVLGVLTASSDWPAARPQARARPTPWVLAWVAWFVATMLWELAAFLLGASPHHPTISDLLDPALAVHAIRSLAFFGWLVLGWRFLQR